MIEITIKNMVNKKTRTFLTILGVVIGIFALVSLVSISEGLNQEANKAFEAFQGIWVLEKGSRIDIFSIIPEGYVDIIEGVPGVRVVNPRIAFLASSINGKSISSTEILGGGLFPPAVVGHDPERMRLSKSNMIVNNMVEGRYMLPGEKYAAVIGDAIMKNYDIQVGSKMEVNGIDFRVVGIYKTGSEFTDNIVVVPLDVAEKMSSLEEGKISTILVDVKSHADIDKVAARIELRLDDVDAQSPEEMAGEFEDLLSSVQTGSLAIASIAGVIGGIGVANSMLMNVMERRREIGILKAVGWTNGEVMKTFILESIIIGLIGGVIGVSIGFVGVRGMEILVPAFRCVITPKLIINALIFAVFLGVLGGLYPAWRSTKIEPIEAIRYE